MPTTKLAIKNRNHTVKGRGNHKPTSYDWRKGAIIKPTRYNRRDGAKTIPLEEWAINACGQTMRGCAVNNQDHTSVGRGI